MTTTTSRIDVEQAAPELYRAMLRLDGAVGKSGLDPQLQDLLKFRVAQMNGCAYCMDMHGRDAVAGGERPERLYVVAGWREAGDLFDERERAALSLMEEMTQIAGHGVSDEVYDAAAEHFSEAELAALIFLNMTINAWTRLGVAAKLTPVTVETSPRAPKPCARCIAPAPRSCCATPGTRPAPRRWSPTLPRWPPPAWGVAQSLGYEDGGHIPAEEAFAALARIVAAVDVPVTADCEAGYGLDPHAFVAGLLGAGAVGCNLEDTDHATGALRDPGENAAFLAAVKQAGRAAGVDLVLNARVDVHVRGGTLEDGLVRARAYREAGADCVYPIFCHEEEGIAAYVEAVGVINVAVHPSAPTIARMGELGVARASFGGGLFHVAMKAAASYEP